MRKLLKNKKGAVGDIITGITQTLGHFISTLPPIGRVMLFLLFLSIFAFVFNILFSIFGYHCDTQQNLYHISWYRFGTNMQLLYDKPNPETINSQELNVEDTFLSISNDCLFQNSSDQNPYYNGNRCTNCTTLTIYPGLPWITGEDVCNGDAYPIEEDDKTWSQKLFCDGGMFDTGACQPPEGYYFNYNTSKYICYKPTFCGNITVGIRWDRNLMSVGEMVEPAPQGKSYTQAFDLTCNENITPEFRFFRIPIFDYRLWMVAIVLTALITILIAIKGMEK